MLLISLDWVKGHFQTLESINLQRVRHVENVKMAANLHRSGLTGESTQPQMRKYSLKDDMPGSLLLYIWMKLMQRCFCSAFRLLNASVRTKMREMLIKKVQLFANLVNLYFTCTSEKAPLIH